MAKVIGIGGIFFLANDPQKLKQWYQRHLGITGVFISKNIDNPEKTEIAEWDIFSIAPPFLKNSTKDFCYSYRVDDLQSLERQLEENDIRQVLPSVTDKDGRFVFIDDPDNNRVILWEPSTVIQNGSAHPSDRVTGLGGLFFKSGDPQKAKDWYQKYLGFDVTKWGCSFKWLDPAASDSGEAETAWSPFPAGTDYFLPSKKDFMLNYRVKNMKGLIESLKSDSVDVVKEIEETDYGNFCSLMDPEGNKIELWEAKADA